VPSLRAKQFQDCNDEDDAVSVRALFASGERWVERCVHDHGDRD
jgi:hypothetical protein